MHADELRECLESFDKARLVMDEWGVCDAERGWRNLAHLAERVGFEQLNELCHPLGRILPRCSDPDMALNNLERYLASSAGREQLPGLLESRARSLEVLLQLLSTSQFFSDLLIANPEYLEMVRIPLRHSPSKAELLAQLQSDVDAAFEDSAVLRAFRRFRQRQVLRIGTNDIIRDRPLEEITRDLSRVADASLEVALRTAMRQVSNRFGHPLTHPSPGRGEGTIAACVIMAFGKLGGEELNYSSDIDLMLIYDEEGGTHGRRTTSISNDDYFARVMSEIVRLLSAHTDRGQAYRIDLRLRPEGQRGSLARSLASTLSYYDTLGRTWERQALIKVRPVAGDLRLGEQFLTAIEPFVYRKYLTFAEINEIKALKRRIEHKTDRAGEADTEVKTGHGGIRDIEFTIQFLQLLNGGELPDIRQRNTLQALKALERVGCLTDQEYSALGDSYRFLRKTEHRLQLLFDLQTHRLPDEPGEVRKLALRMGYREGAAVREQGLDDLLLAGTSPMSTAADPSPRGLDSSFSEPTFVKDYREKTTLNRRILDHLLHQTFEEKHEEAAPETDLILHPNPDPERIQAVLGRYPFRDVQAVYQNLMLLACEEIPFLSTRRCRHFLASIAPQLLKTLADTPDPDMALVNLEKVSASLGGKGVLWELFSFSKPSLDLYVDLCAWSQFLCEILMNNPGMVDELLDSLVLNKPRSQEELRDELKDLLRGAEDLVPILHSFRDKELLRIGVRDILGKDDIRGTTAALSDLAETILDQIAARQFEPMTRRYGVPYLAEGERAGQTSRFMLLALGKLGGQEMSYHSDLDLILVYEGDGRTGAPPGASRFERFELTDNFHFFTELARQIIKTTSFHGPMGQLYQVDMRLRPTGKSGSLVIPLSEFRRYYVPSAHEGRAEGGAQLWERQALSRARAVFGEPDFAAQVMHSAAEAAFGFEWKPEYAEDVRTMRERLEAGTSERDLKRGFGGITDVEFVVQMLRLKNARNVPLSNSNTWQALDDLRAANLLSSAEHQTLSSCYDFLRRVESRLRILQNRALDELPDRPEDVEKLARRLDFGERSEQSAAAQFLEEMDRHTTRTRQLFLELIEKEKASAGPPIESNEPSA